MLKRLDEPIWHRFSAHWSSEVARAPGGASTLYAYMRAGTFFIPCRRVNDTAMIKADDFIDGCLSRGSGRG